MRTQSKRISVFHLKSMSLQIHIRKKLSHHGKRLSVGYDGCIGIIFHEIINICGMIRLHMLDNQIIRRLSLQNTGQIVQPFVSESGINRIHNSTLLIANHIGVIAHPVGNLILSFKKIYAVIINACINNISGNFHYYAPFFVIALFYHEYDDFSIKIRSHIVNFLLIFPEHNIFLLPCHLIGFLHLNPEALPLIKTYSPGIFCIYPQSQSGMLLFYIVKETAPYPL